MPTVSVIMSVYNGQAVVERSVQAVLGNTFTDFELLIVNDGSTDDTAAVLETLAKTDSRIRVFTLPQNKGQAAARNFGLQQSEGEFIAFADADDWVEPHWLQTLLDAMDIKCDMVICGFYMDIEKDGYSKSVVPPHMRFAQHAHILEYFVQLKDTFLLDALSNKLFRAAFLKEHNLQMPEGEIFEDTAFVLQILKHTSQVSTIEEPLYHYMQNDGSTTRKFQPRKLEFLKLRYLQMLDYFGEQASSLLKGYAAQFLLTCYFSYYADLFLPSANLTNKQIRQTIQTCSAEPEFKAAVERARGRNRTQNRTIRVAKKSVGAQYRYAKTVYLLKYKWQKLFLRLK